MGNLQVTNIHEVKLDESETPFDSSDTKCYSLTIPPEGTSLNMIIKNDHTFNLTYLHRMNPRHKWRSNLHKNLETNTWITQIDND